MVFTLLASITLIGIGKGGNMADADEANLMVAKKLVSNQLELIKAGKVEELKATFSDRVKDRVTADGVTKAQGQLKTMTIDDLVASVQLTADGMKVKMKNGRTLTTFVAAGTDWKADTLWFR